MAATNIPFSKANVRTIFDYETVAGQANVAVSKSKQVAYDSNAIVRQQTLTANVELVGDRYQRAYIPGPKNPGGAFTSHMTDQMIVAAYEAMLGKRVTTTYVVPAPTAVIVLASGAVDVGTHSYKVVFNKTGRYVGATTPSTASTIITTDGTHGKVNVTRPGPSTLPTGWTWDVYRTVVGNGAPWKLVNPTPLAGSVVTYLDNIADSALGASAPGAGAADDYQHVITINSALPTWNIERSIPYGGPTPDATQYSLALGCTVDRGRVAMKSTGFYDMALDILADSVSTQNSSFETGTPIDWRSGEKLHHAMIGTGKVLLGPVGGAMAANAKFLDFSLDHQNTLDKTDFPLTFAGDRGSLIAGIANTTVSGTIKVSDNTVLSMLQNPANFWAISIEHDFATPFHSLLHEFLSVQFDPTDAATTGQGIQTVAFNGHVSKEAVSGEQIRITCINGESGTPYTAP
jgi:hypothetical protein